MRALAVSSAKRLPGIDVPTLKEQGIDVELSNWRAVFGAPGITDAQKKDLIDGDKTVKSSLAGDAEAERLEGPVPSVAMRSRPSSTRK